MIPSERQKPVITVGYGELYGRAGLLVPLPGGARICATSEDVYRLVARELPGTDVKFSIPSSPSAPLPPAASSPLSFSSGSAGLLEAENVSTGAGDKPSLEL